MLFVWVIFKLNSYGKVCKKMLIFFYFCFLICIGFSRRMVKSCGNVFVFGKLVSL